MVTVLLLAVLVQASVSSTDWQAQGLKALDDKNYALAAEAFRHAVEQAPTDYVPRFHLALAYSLLDRDAEATKAFRETLELKPGLYEAQLNLGILLIRQHQPAEAATLLAAASEAKPAEFRPRFYEGTALLDAGKAEQAERAFTRALALDPKSAPAEAGLARALIAESKLDSASEHAAKAAALEAGNRDILLELAAAYEKAGRKTDAASIYKQFPERPEARERAGELLLESGSNAEAAAELEAAVKASPTSANRMALVQAYLREKQTDKAFGVIAQAVQADPKNLDLRLLAGRMLRDQRKFPEAAAQFFAASQIDPKSVEAWNELSGALILAEKYPEALAALDKVRELGGEKAAHHYFRAIVLDKLHQIRPALESYQKFLAMSQGQRPDEEFKARQRARILERELARR